MHGSKRSNGGVTPTASHAGVISGDTVDDHRHRKGTRPSGKVSSSPSPRKDASLVGRVLGDFELGEVLGRGGGGTVYRAEQRGLDRPAVVKVVHRALAARS